MEEMMKVLNCLFLGCLLFIFSGLLHSCAKDEIETMGIIYGIVNDDDNGQPIQDAHVSLTPYGKTINTGSDGGYEFPEVEPGQYTIQISKLGYKTNTKRITVVAGEKASGDMKLQRGTSSIKLSVVSLNFGSKATSKMFTVRNIGTSGSPVSWTVEKASTAAWLSVNPPSGNTASEKESTVIVNVDRTKVTKDETAALLVVADGESFSVSVTVSLNGSEDEDELEGGSCGTITPFDTKLKTSFVQCIKIGNTVEFLFKITNSGEDVTLTFDTSLLKGYDSEGNTFTFNNSELWLSGERISSGLTTSMTFPKNVLIPGHVVLKNVSSSAMSIARYEVVSTSSKPWKVLNEKMMFENVRW